MNEPLSAEDVSITTASIEVKVIRIGKRQMTQAVFRQIPHAIPFDYEGRLTGQPWGIVNYHNRCDPEEHLHVIWQRGVELRQYTMIKHPWIGGWSERHHAFLNGAVSVRTSTLERDFDANFRAIWGAIYVALANLDQLFIAV